MVLVGPTPLIVFIEEVRVCRVSVPLATPHKHYLSGKYLKKNSMTVMQFLSVVSKYQPPPLIMTYAKIPEELFWGLLENCFLGSYVHFVQLNMKESAVSAATNYTK